MKYIVEQKSVKVHELEAELTEALRQVTILQLHADLGSGTPEVVTVEAVEASQQ